MGELRGSRSVYAQTIRPGDLVYDIQDEGDTQMMLCLAVKNDVEEKSPFKYLKLTFLTENNGIWTYSYGYFYMFVVVAREQDVRKG